MKLLFNYYQDSDGNISQLQVVRPVTFWEDRSSGFTIGDEMLFSCLRKYEITEDKRGFTFNLEYDSTMLSVLEYLGK